MNNAAQPLLTPPFLLMLLTSLIVGMSFSTYFLLPKFLAVELAADAATIGGLSAVSLLASVFCMPYAGVQIDRHGRRLFVTLGAVVFAIACAGYLFVDRVGPLLWILRLVQGIGWPLYYLALSTLATDIAPKARMGQAIGMFGGVMISTNALGPALAEWGAHQFGWQAVFAATVVAALVAAVLAHWLPDNHQPQAREDTSTMAQLMRRPGLMRVLVVTAMVGWTFGAMFTFYQPWALASGFKQVSAFLVAFAGCAMVMRLGLGGLADRLGRLRVAKVTLVLYCIAPLTLVWLPTLGLFVTGALLGLAHGMFFPAFNAVAVEYAEESERGKAMGAYNGAFNIGFAAGSYLLGYVAIATSFPTIFVIASLTCMAAFALLMRTAPEHTRPANHAARN
ncbi:MAG: MFS transporter [Gammaproteobacteria bacterium]|nr:MFS transporter [Gammaproteobacteria bacterium]